jgi:hypothetical protein
MLVLTGDTLELLKGAGPYRTINNKPNQERYSEIKDEVKRSHSHLCKWRWWDVFQHLECRGIGFQGYHYSFLSQPQRYQIDTVLLLLQLRIIIHDMQFSYLACSVRSDSVGAVHGKIDGSVLEKKYFRNIDINDALARIC